MTPTFVMFLLASPTAFAADADGDGVALEDGDCNDNDPLTYPGAPERCDGFDNDCGGTGIAASVLLQLGHGNNGEVLAWRPTDGLWYHGSGTSNGQQYFETVDLATLTVGANLAVGNTYGPDAAGELTGLVWYEPLGVFFALDLSGLAFHITPSGQFTQINGGGGGTGGTGWYYYYNGPQSRGFAVVGDEIFGVDRSSGTLYSFDPATAAVNYTRQLTMDGQNLQGCNGITMDPTNGRVYGICDEIVYGYYGGTDRHFVEIDVNTGVTYDLGSTGQQLSGVGIDDEGRIIAVAGDGNWFGQPETLYEITPLGAGGPQPGEFDVDADGYLACEECDDSRATVYPGALELCDGLDNNCDGSLPANEQDQDGDGTSVCAGDCDDNNANLSPNLPEYCDGEDNNCDGLPGPNEFDQDGDGDLACSDCNDADPNIYHGAPEVCDGRDSDCNGSLPAVESADADGDGVVLCMDCDDDDPARAPGKVEGCDGIDNDCDGEIRTDEADEDGDGFRICGGDCDDTNPFAHPAGVELAGDGVDQDCSGADLPGGSADGTGTGTGGGGGGDDKEGGCGCNAQPSAPGGLLLLLPLALIALRRGEHGCAS